MEEVGNSMAISIPYPEIEELLSPLLASLPAAAVSSQSPTVLLPLLTPILRQRVKFLLLSTSDPWLPLLSYDDTNESVLNSIATSNLLELHPVSGQVEMDWESDADIRFNRVDCETFQALVMIRRLDLSIKLQWCTNDPVGFNGCDGWRIGEVRLCNTDDHTWGTDSICLAEDVFTSKKSLNTKNINQNKRNESIATPENEDKKDDDEYWARYDNTATQTPPPRNFPVSPVIKSDSRNSNDDEYYSHYDMVQPAMDNHDPDEAVDSGIYEIKIMPNQTIGASKIIEDNHHSLNQNRKEIWKGGLVDSSMLCTSDQIQHSGTNSHVPSNGSNIVTNIRQQDASDSLSRNAITTHIEVSLKSLFRLARTTGIGREDFDRIVKAQLESLNMMNNEGGDF